MEKKYILLLFLFLMLFSKQEPLTAKNERLFLSLEDTGLLRPIKINNIDINTGAKSILSVLFDEDKKRELISKNIDQALPIASITKLMTAVIVLENYDLNEEIVISQKAIDAFEDTGSLKLGEKIKVNDLLYIMLIESSNDAAEALAEKMGRDNFLSKMNEKAEELVLKETKFFNPTGLTINEINLSSANDLKNLAYYIIKKHLLIAEILSNSSKDLYIDNVFHHRLENTNILLLEDNNYIWGKTGYTSKAKGCIVLVMKPFDAGIDDDFIITVILGAEDRFNEARGAENYLKNSFIW